MIVFATIHSNSYSPLKTKNVHTLHVSSPQVICLDLTLGHVYVDVFAITFSLFSGVYRGKYTLRWEKEVKCGRKSLLEGERFPVVSRERYLLDIAACLFCLSVTVSRRSPSSSLVTFDCNFPFFLRLRYPLSRVHLFSSFLLCDHAALFSSLTTCPPLCVILWWMPTALLKFLYISCSSSFFRVSVYFGLHSIVNWAWDEFLHSLIDRSMIVVDL